MTLLRARDNPLWVRAAAKKNLEESGISTAQIFESSQNYEGSGESSLYDQNLSIRNKSRLVSMTRKDGLSQLVDPISGNSAFQLMVLKWPSKVILSMEGSMSLVFCWDVL